MHLIYKIWYETPVPIFLEKFLLVVLAGSFLANILTNPFKLGIHYRIAFGIIILGFSYLIAISVYQTLYEPKIIAQPQANNPTSSNTQESTQGVNSFKSSMAVLILEEVKQNAHVIYLLKKTGEQYKYPGIPKKDGTLLDFSNLSMMRGSEFQREAYLSQLPSIPQLGIKISQDLRLFYSLIADISRFSDELNSIDKNSPNPQMQRIVCWKEIFRLSNEINRFLDHSKLLESLDKAAHSNSISATH
jgi:hypothetical protein